MVNYNQIIIDSDNKLPTQQKTAKIQKQSKQNLVYLSKKEIKLIELGKYLPAISLIVFITTIYLSYYYFVKENNALKVEFEAINFKNYAVKNLQENSPQTHIPQFIKSHQLYEVCSQRLCDISYYGGWPGTPYYSFKLGITILTFIVLFIVNIRILLWYKCFQAVKIQLKREIEQQISNSQALEKQKKQENQLIAGFKNDQKKFKQMYNVFIFVGFLSNVGSFCLLPMAYIPFFVSQAHFLFAASTFILLSISEFIDLKIYTYFFGALKLQKEAFKYTRYQKGVMWAGNLSFFLWFAFEEYGASFFEYLGAATPFMYLLPFSSQYILQKRLILQFYNKYQ